MADLQITFDPIFGAQATKKLESDLAKAGKKAGQKASDGFSGSFKKGLTRFDVGVGAAFGTLAANAVLSFVSTVSSAFTESIEAANRQEDAINALNASLRQTGVFTERTSQSLQAFAASLQQTTVFGDEVILEQIAFAKSLGLTVDESQKVVSAATELSAALNISLDSAVRNISKTFSGLQGELGELVPQVRELTKEQLQAGEAVTVIANQFRGAGAAQTETFSGAVTQLSNSFGDLQEAFGAIITQSSVVQSSIRGITSAIQALTPSVKDPQDEIDQLTEKLAKLREEREGFRPTTGDPSAFQQRQIDALTTGIDQTIGQLERLRLAQKASDEAEEREANAKAERAEVRRQQEIERERNALANIGLTREAQIANQFAKEEAQLQQARENKIISEDEFTLRLAELEQQRFEQLEEIRKGNRERQRNREEQEREGVIREANTLGGIFGNLGDAFEIEAKKIKISALDVARSSLNILSAGVGKAFSNVGKAIAQGGNAFDAFKEGLKGTLGEIASATGDLFIKQGVGYLFFNPAAGLGLIAAGGALKVLGGFLGASGGGTSGGAVGAGGIGGATDFGFPEPQTFQQAEEEERQATQQVQLVVNGDILDSEDTGRRLVDLLNENFEREGSTVVGANFA